MLEAAIVRLRARVVGLALGCACGGVLFLMTAWLVVRGGENVGAHLGLLANYLPGYSVTWGGSVLGGLYGFVLGAVLGFCLARIYNRLGPDSRKNGAK
ncbi:MAG: hypothetical protein CMJ84_07700 [Planctomycetes bacterium]|nr:hypothetical protein [Planctomycetota bacterium]